MIKCLVVDDEPIGRLSMSSLLQKYEADGIQVVGMASNIEDAFNLILEHQPDAIFLDINMPGSNGFKLLEKFDEIPFKIIFVTAYSDFSIKALRTGAIDYVLKPIDENEFVHTIDRLKKQLEKKNTPADFTGILTEIYKQIQQKDPGNKIMIPHSKGYRFINADEIIRLEGDYGYTTFYFTDNTKLIVSKNFKDFQNILDEEIFIRVHKSHIVNKNYIKEYISRDGGYFEMIDKSIVPVVKKNIEHFLKKK